MQLAPESPVWEHVKKIETVALRAAELTNQMLAYSGKSKFVVGSFNLTSLVKEMTHLLEVSISKRIKLEYNFTEEGTLIDGDASQIRQVVMNLITNASDAIGNKKGTIVVSTGVMDCPASYLAGCYIAGNTQPGRYVFVEVSDTGCGMDIATQQKMFDPFFTTKVKGRGLGLAAVLGIVRSHKGTLKVYSELGKGTNFKVLFLRSSAKPQAVKAAEKERADWRGSGTILVVDDDELIRSLTQQILETFGFSVLTAGDARTAIKQCDPEIGKLTAVVLDVTLPETSAQEMIEEIRRTAGQIPIILFSGYNEMTATADMKPGSFDGFLQKPFTSDALAKVIREALDEK
jgi:CheY-like chemotaxis protein